MDTTETETMRPSFDFKEKDDEIVDDPDNVLQ
jgi:hypothetical protein